MILAQILAQARLCVCCIYVCDNQYMYVCMSVCARVSLELPPCVYMLCMYVCYIGSGIQPGARQADRETEN